MVECTLISSTLSLAMTVFCLSVLFGVLNRDMLPGITKDLHSNSMISIITSGTNQTERVCVHLPDAGVPVLCSPPHGCMCVWAGHSRKQLDAGLDSALRWSCGPGNSLSHLHHAC